MEYRNKRWKNRRPSQERITFQKVGDRTMPTEPPIRRVRYSSSSYNVSLTLDDGTITVSGKAKGAYTPSITGRMPKGGELELAYTFLPLAGEEDLDEIVEELKKLNLQQSGLRKTSAISLRKKSRHPTGINFPDGVFFGWKNGDAY